MCWRFVLIFLFLSSALAQFPQSLRLDELRDSFHEGKYEEVFKGLDSLPSYRLKPGHFQLRVEAELATGAYSNAVTSAEKWLEREPQNLAAMQMVQQTYRLIGETEKADAQLKAIDERGRKSNPKELPTDDLIALGEAALAMGADPKQILDQCFLPARKKNPRDLKAHLVAAGLAIEKQDYALGASLLQDARKVLGNQPDLLHLLGQAWMPSQRERATALAEQALGINSNHVGSLLLLAEHAMDEEVYTNAVAYLNRAEAVNPLHAKTWALRSALAFIQHDDDAGLAAQTKAFRYPPDDPAVWSLIGRKLSQKRRFEDGAARQREALKIDPEYLPARAALGQDLLRLGREDEAWPMIEAVHEADPYNVVAFNLMTLHDQMKSFVSLTNAYFVVRMTPDEVGVYGDRVMEILESARVILGKRYGYELESESGAPIVVEFFPDQADFAIRTLGFPGGLGLLGACFGRVITMNSPGSYGALESNWETTLWHEFCHAVTLGATNNRIPRWLTEGCSVHAESGFDPTHSRTMRAKYRRLIEARGFIPLEKLSKGLTSFSQPETIDFAYFQSGQIVARLLEKYGEEMMHGLFADLERGMPEEAAFAKNRAPVEEWWPEITNAMAEAADDYCSDLDWELPDDPTIAADPDRLAEWLEGRFGNLWGLELTLRQMVEAERWDDAAEVAEELKELCPEHASTYRFLSLIERRRNNGVAEKEALHEWVSRSADAEEGCLRLLEVETASENWEAVLKVGPRQLAINPLLRIPHWALGRAYEDAGEKAKAVAAYERLLRLGPTDVADVHLRLAKLKQATDRAGAKRHVLQALEEAPRFREAYSVLRELTEMPQKGE